MLRKVDMSTKRQSDGIPNVFSIRMHEDEHKRYTELWQLAKKRHKFVGKSDINREIMGMSKPFILTDAEIRYFRTGEPIKGGKK